MTPQPPPQHARAPGFRLGLVVVGVGALGLYLFTLAPTIFAGDAAELATAGTTWGIPHPPGYPLYSLVANLWCRLLPWGDAAGRLNLMSAVAATAALTLAFLFLLRAGAGWAVASATALSLAVGRTFWSQALISEVYAFDVLLLAATLVAAQSLARRPTWWRLFWLGLVAGAWLTHRPVNLLYVPAPLLVAWPGLWRPGEGPPRYQRLLIGAAGALLPWAVVLAYLPLASARQPLLDSVDPESWSRLWELLSASVYRRYLFAAPVAQQGAYLLGALPRELGLLLPLGFLGAFFAWREQRRVSVALLLLVSANALFVLTYGVPDVLAFTLPGAVGVCLLAGLAAGALWNHGRAPLRRGLLAVLLAGLALLLVFNFADNDLSRQRLVRHFARDALELPTAKAVVISHVDTVTFSLWYVQAVEGYRSDLEIVSRGRAVPWYQAQVRRRRPDLVIPTYEGEDAASHWPAQIVERNRGRVDLYITTDLRGSFFDRDARRLAGEVQQLPAGLLVRLAPREQAIDHARVVAENERLWAKAWPHAVAARRQRLDTDMTAVLLHYASMRLLYGRYCALHGQLAAAERAARDVVALDTAPSIALVNRAFARQRARYHLSNMPQLAAQLLALCQAVSAGRLEASALPRLLDGRAVVVAPPRVAAPTSMPHVPPPAPASSPTSIPAGDAVSAEALNQQGITLGKAGRLQEALALFARAVERDPSHHGARFNQAKLLALLGQPDASRRAYQQLLRRSPHYTLGLFGLAELELARDRRAARALYERARKSPGYLQLKGLIDRRLAELRDVH